MRTADEYLTSLDDGRATFFEGHRVPDLLREPLLAQAARNVAAGYDQWYQPGEQSLNPLMTPPASEADLRARVPMLLSADFALDLSYQALMALSTAAAALAELPGPFVDRIKTYVEEAQRRDDRVAVCVTDAKGNRSLPPGKQPDPDSYTRVVERRDDGVVIRGAKLHISGASFCHDLLVMPTKAMKPGEEDYAICAAVPLNAPGVSVINTTFAPRHADARTFPYSSQHHIPDGFVVFDDVFVPHERVFLDGEARYAAVFAHNLGMWQRLGSLAFMAADADRMVGFAQLAADANGLTKVAHITEKISELMIHATMVRAGLEAAIANCEQTPAGVTFPSELYTNAAKYHAAANAAAMSRHIHDIAGGSLVTAPSVADLENPETGDAVRKYMTTTVDGEYRLKLFHAMRDLTADSYGAWRQVTNLQGGGGLYAQRIVTRKYYDIEAAKKAALDHVGLGDPAVKHLNGKVAVVTGGGAGIGEALSIELASRGVTVAVCDVSGVAAKGTVERILAAGGQASAHTVDVASEAHMRALVNEVRETHPVIDILVNNAGVTSGPAPTTEDRLADFHKLIDINLWGMVHGAVFFLPALQSRPEANLVNVSSYTGLVGIPSMAGYSTSKFAARGFTECLQMECAGGPVKVTAVYPGVTRTSLMRNSPVLDDSSRELMQASLEKSRSVPPQTVAHAIVRGIERNRPRVLIGSDTRALDVISRLAPGGYPRLLARPMQTVLRKTLG